MVNRCCVYGCLTNQRKHNTGSVFPLPKEESVKKQWINFINRADINSLKNVYVCEFHFEEKYLKRNDRRVHLLYKLDPVPNILSDDQKDVPSSVLPKVSKPRKTPTERRIQSDQIEEFKKMDTITNYSDINETLLNFLDKDFLYSNYEDHTIYYKMEVNDMSVPEVTECIRIDSNLRVKLFYRRSPVPLPSWFRQGRDTKLTSKSMLENFSCYIREELTKHGNIWDELQQIRLQKCPVYSPNILRYALLLRYSSKPAYEMLLKEFKLPSLSLLRKVTSGSIDIMASAKALKENGSISEDVVLLFDEMYLQKCEEYDGGETIGSNETGALYSGIVCFMIVGVKSNVPYVISSIPETKIQGDWLKDKIEDCLNSLKEAGFNVRGIVCDNHASNVSAYKKLLNAHGSAQEDLFIIFHGKKVYLFYDTVHLMKNIRNNLLNRKRFIFPPFKFHGFYDDINVTSGEITWKCFYDVYEKDKKIQSNLRAAPQLSTNAIHPGNCKQSVPAALAIFHPSTSAAIIYYFPEKKDASQFLNLVNIWWTISNSKLRINSNNSIGNAAVEGDQKPLFLREFADWIESWDGIKIPNAEKFTLTAQTSSALRRTLRCHACLIEDLLGENYNFVLTARFQSDHLERRYGQYRQMSGGRFLVSLKDVKCSEKILKIKSLLKEQLDINQNFEDKNNYENGITELLHTAEAIDVNALQLTDSSREISDYIAGYIAYKSKKFNDGCCDDYLISKENPANGSYLNAISRGGLKIPSKTLSDYVAQGFAILDACSTHIRTSGVPSRKAGENVLCTMLTNGNLACPKHESIISVHVNRTLVNIYFNNQRKRVTNEVLKDKIVQFKRSKREK